MDNAARAHHYRRIVLRGVVQGVGFRPFVQRVAARFGVLGTIRNAGGTVVVHARGAPDAMARFLRELQEAPPPGAWIADFTAADATPFDAESFVILPSGGAEAGGAFVAPDVAVCEHCLNEIRDGQNRRYGHPFNSCAVCGPRYSVVEKPPYDRENTAMRDFPLCAACENEYADVRDRRCHAQTVCCRHCGPRLFLTGRDGDRAEGEQAFSRAVSLLKQGRIVAVKGLGGYHFACLPACEEAVAALRLLKGRDAKPFAVMLRDAKAVRGVCSLSDEEERLLVSPARPIVLLELIQNAFAPSLLCGDDRCGCFLPYTALHQMLLDETPALALTSANPGGAAIFTEDEHMIRFFETSAQARFAGVLSHDRRIVRSVEDSVAQIAGGQIQVLRRARGYAPNAIALKTAAGQDYLAFGGDLKASFCVVKDGYAYPGPHLGDLAEKSVYDRFRASAREFCSLLGARPAFVLCDKHPGYFSSALAMEWDLPVKRIQHHHAHVASAAAEHGLCEKVIGVAFDGAGCGEDGGVWGGEFFICREDSFRRAGHLRNVRLLGGDDLARDAQKTAFGYLWNANAVDLERMDARARVMAAALKSGVNTSSCSSMGRLFDAAAAILGIATRNDYEGRCAILLQRCAQRALKTGATPYPLRFSMSEEGGVVTADGAALVRDLFLAADRADRGALALGFHVAVAELTLVVCNRLREEERCNAVVLSGGVFQNGLLLTTTLERLKRAGFDVYVNHAVPPNDGGIALGQAYIGGFSSCV